MTINLDWQRVLALAQMIIDEAKREYPNEYRIIVYADELRRLARANVDASDAAPGGEGTP